MKGEIIGLIVILLLLFVFVFSGSSLERMRGHPGHPRLPGRSGHPGWRPRYYRMHNAPWDYGRYGLAYRTPVYYDVSVNESDKPGLMWCGVARTEGSPCSSEETVAVAGEKIYVAACPNGYNDNGFKKYSNESYRRVCELSI